jgi:hypothetical protein
VLSRILPAIVCAVVLAMPQSSSAATLLPPAGKVFAGVGGGQNTAQYAAQTGAHPAVFQFFTGWGGDTGYVFRRTDASRARAMFHISTQAGSGREIISPLAIARGQGDGYLLRLNRAIAAHGKPVYIRLMAEMDGHWNVYCAYDASGRSRGPSHSTAAFRAAWRRTVLIVRGGDVATIDRRLHALHLPAVHTAAAGLPVTKVAFLWVPQVAGAPDTAANAPSAYWPGGRYVDWVGTDFYSRFPNWSGLESFYRRFTGKPFVFGEWALWGADDPGFVSQFFGWVHSHKRVRMVMYNQGDRTAGPFRLRRYPRAAKAIRSALNSSTFPGLVPEELAIP